MSQNKLGYLAMEISGIQKFIFATKKLSEMVTGSEIIESIFKSVLTNFIKEKNYSLVYPNDFTESCDPKENQILAIQINAGIANLLFSSIDRAKEFLKEFCIHVLGNYPGIPLYGATCESEWSISSLNESRSKTIEKLRKKRALNSSSQGMLMQPFCIKSKLDGLPVIPIKNEKDKEKDKEYELSILSATRQNYESKHSAKKRLQEIGFTPKDLGLREDATWSWSDDLSSIVGSEGKIALVHMDGNDLGRLFLGKLQDQDNGQEGQLDPSKNLKEMSELSSCVEKSNKAAMKAAFKAILKYVYVNKVAKQEYQINYEVPVRPIVLGGDDVTVLIRSDLALLFVMAYTKEFEKQTKQLNKGKKLSLGAGIVIANKTYPFSKVFEIAEGLLDKAKSLTNKGYDGYQNRPSSIDYHVITNDVEWEVDVIREHLFSSKDGSLLTAKPFFIEDISVADNEDRKRKNLYKVIEDGVDVINQLPRGTLRGTLAECRVGLEAGNKVYAQVKRNVERGLGGRKDKSLMSKNRFEEIFGDKSFFIKNAKGQEYTLIGDYLELAQMLPKEIFDNEKSIADASFKAYMNALEDNK